MLMGRAVDIIELFSHVKHGNMFCATQYLPYSTADIAMKLLQGPLIQQLIYNECEGVEFEHKTGKC